MAWWATSDQVSQARDTVLAAIATLTGKVEIMSDTVSAALARIQYELDGVVASEAAEVTSIGALGAAMVTIAAGVEALKAAGVSPAQQAAIAQIEAGVIAAQANHATISAALTNVGNATGEIIANLMVNPPPNTPAIPVVVADASTPQARDKTTGQFT